MKHFLSAALVLGLVAVIAGCPTSTGATDDDRICTPGNYVFCRCADRTKGTKLCEPDGKTFAACSTKADGECKGGEVQDVDTNKKVDGNGDVLPTDDDDTPQGDGGGDGPSDMDICPGKPISLPPGQEILLEGDTSRATGDRRGKPGGACASSIGARDFIYHLIPSGTGKIAVKVTGQGALDPIVYARTTCDDETTQQGCGPQSGTKVASMSFTAKTGTDYFLFIDGASGGTGAYSATVKLTTGIVCGDGQVDTGEACDDGNNAEDDGCAASCRAVDGNPTSGGTCPGHPVDLWKGSTVLGQAGFKTTNANGMTVVYVNSLGTPDPATCATLPASGKNTTSDHVYKVTPHSAGTLTVKLDKEKTQASLPPNLFLSAHTTCSATAPTSLCTVGTAPLVMTVESGKDVFIAVDGSTDGSERYQISFNLK